MTYLLLAIVAGGFLLTRDALLRYVESMADKKPYRLNASSWSAKSLQSCTV